MFHEQSACYLSPQLVAWLELCAFLCGALMLGFRQRRLRIVVEVRVRRLQIPHQS